MALSQILSHYFFFNHNTLVHGLLKLERVTQNFCVFVFLLCWWESDLRPYVYQASALTFNFRLLPLVSGMKFEHQVI